MRAREVARTTYKEGVYCIRRTNAPRHFCITAVQYSIIGPLWWRSKHPNDFKHEQAPALAGADAMG